MNQPVAIVTGSNRGIGFAIVKALCGKFPGTVYLTSRNTERGLKAVESLKELNYNPKFHELDISQRESVQKFAAYLKKEHSGIAVLVNNAAILEWESIFPTYEVAKRTIDTNYRSLLYMEEFIYPLLIDGARVVNVCSAAGHLSNLRNKDWIATLQSKDLTVDKINKFVEDYLESVRNGTFSKEDFADGGKHAEFRVSKIAVAALSMLQAKKYRNRGICINLVHPGHVKTEMAYGGGEIEPDEAVKNIMYLILEASPNLSGTFMWHDGKLIDWYNEGEDLYLRGLW